MSRRAIPAAVKRAVLARSGGMCEAPDCDAVGKEFEHRTPVALGGENTEQNLWLACRECHRAKTSNEDIPRIAKAKRQARETGRQREGKVCRKIASRGFQPGHRPLQSRGFPKAKPQRSATKPIERGGVK